MHAFWCRDANQPVVAWIAVPDTLWRRRWRWEGRNYQLNLLHRTVALTGRRVVVLVDATRRFAALPGAGRHSPSGGEAEASHFEFELERRHRVGPGAILCTLFDLRPKARRRRCSRSYQESLGTYRTLLFPLGPRSRVERVTFPPHKAHILV